LVKLHSRFMNNNLKVSIILPAYNAEITIRRSVDSALDQNFSKQDFEIIVINDGSTDGTLEILKSYGNTIRLLDQENQGALPTSNRGFREAKGQYVIKLDADDCFERDIIKEMAEILDENPDIDFVYCDYYEKTIGGETKIISTRDNVFNTIGLGIMFRKHKFEEQGFFDEKALFAEYDLLLKTADKWKGFCIEKPLFYYIRRKESITGGDNWVEKAIDQLKELYPQNLEEIDRIREY